MCRSFGSARALPNGSDNDLRGELGLLDRARQREGDAHAYVIYFEPRGVIGPHEARFGQIPFAVAGSGWVSGGDGQRIALAECEAAFISRGEVHSKGSESGMTAFMVQVRDLTPLVHYRRAESHRGTFPNARPRERSVSGLVAFRLSAASGH